MSHDRQALYAIESVMVEDAPADGLVESLLELGDMTSRNLAFVHRGDGGLSYGEETITETNLLELRRRHPARTYLKMFTKRQESVTGADWEWHIVGSRRTLRMRIQAKRLQSNGVLKVRHRVKSSGALQRDLLIDHASEDQMRPMYCTYSSERQRTRWTRSATQGVLESYETGCLLADARDVRPSVTGLIEIEDMSYPWHFLVERELYARWRCLRAQRPKHSVSERVGDRRQRPPIIYDDQRTIGPMGTGVGTVAATTGRGMPPTVHSLNDDDAASEESFDRSGVRETTEQDRALLDAGASANSELTATLRARLEERGVRGILAIDAREEDDEARA